MVYLGKYRDKKVYEFGSHVLAIDASYDDLYAVFWRKSREADVYYKGELWGKMYYTDGDNYRMEELKREETPAIKEEEKTSVQEESKETYKIPVASTYASTPLLLDDYFEEAKNNIDKILEELKNNSEE